MNKETSWQIALNRILYFMIVFIGIFILLIPVSIFHNILMSPEIIFMITLILIIRNPDYVPVWLIGIVFLLNDFLLTLPLGLNTFIALLTTEFLRRNRLFFIEMLFLTEWLCIAIFLLAANVMRELLLIITLSEHAPGFTVITQVGLSILIYPILVVLVSFIFRIGKAQRNTLYSAKSIR